jgi:hypothetical protein
MIELAMVFPKGFLTCSTKGEQGTPKGINEEKPNPNRNTMGEKN